MVRFHRRAGWCRDCGLVSGMAAFYVPFGGVWISDAPSLESRMPVTCINCKYDLTGTLRTGQCPECGQAADASYEEFDIQQARPPIRAAAWAAIILSALGASSAVALVLWAAIGGGSAADDIMFAIALVVWNMSPFLGLVWLAVMVGRRRVPAIAALIVSVVVTVFIWWWYGVLLRANDPLAGMILLGAPAMAWIGVAPALLIGAYHVLRTRRTQDRTA
jgi:hypothetical protein